MLSQSFGNPLILSRGMGGRVEGNMAGKTHCAGGPSCANADIAAEHYPCDALVQHAFTHLCA